MKDKANSNTAAEISSPVCKKKRRTLRDAESELSECRAALREARRKLVVTARENAKMRVLLMKYMEKDDSLLCTSQLSEPSSQRAVVSDAVGTDHSQSTDPAASTSGASLSDGREESSEDSLWTDLSTTELEDSEDRDTVDSCFVRPAQFSQLSQLSQLSQASQASQWSELSTTSHLEDIITFLEKQDGKDETHVESMEAELQELKQTSTVVRVGVGVLVTCAEHPHCVLLGQRKGSHGAGKFALPGGHLEMFETWTECAVREIKEETDLVLDPEAVKMVHVTNDPMPDEGKHYITIFMHATVDKTQVPRLMEPDKCEGWAWVDWDALCQRDDLFIPLWHLTHSAFTPSF